MDTSSTPPDKHHRSPPESISYGVWLYFRFCLSDGGMEERLWARGLIMSDAARAEKMLRVS